ncbi:tRNA uridine-5-carboxymethylaminomethyl(34) synthesis GTPase MnmE [Calditrichota bacterium GD2]
MNEDYLSKDTIIAPISGLSGGSVHLIRISGTKAVEITSRFFSNSRFSQAEKNRFFYGQLVNEQNEPLDDVIVLLYRKPHSYTGEDVVEISCHGNILITEQIIELYLRQGCRLAQPGEFTKRAFMNGRIDLVQAESIASLISARSEKALKNAIQQLEGKFSLEIKEIKQDLIQSISLLELNLDFAEEDIEVIEDQQVLILINKIMKKIEKYLNSYQQGKLLLNGVQVLITGKPNVGKSSLMNALLEKDRVLVSDIPGTTRDFVHDEIYLENVLVKFIDTAGIRISDDKLEKEGIKRAEKLFSDVDLILFLFDASQPLDDEDFYLIKKLKDFKEKVVFVGNKIDLNFLEENKQYLAERPLLKISAKNRINIESIKDQIKKIIHKTDTQQVIISNERQYGLLKKAREELKRAKNTLTQKTGHEFVAMELREVVDLLSEITGEITNEDILNNIFANFCIGK